MKQNRNDRREQMGAYGTMILVAAIVLLLIIKMFL